MAFLARGYGRLLTKHPLATQAGTTGALMASGDLIAQTFIQKREKIDGWQTARFFVCGCFLTGPALRYWYIALDRIYGAGIGSKIIPLKKVVTDQCVSAPTLVSANMIALEYLRPGVSWDQSVDKWKNNIVGMMLENWKIWYPAQMITFYLIPLPYRVPFVSIVALVWNTWFAYLFTRQTPEAIPIATAP